MQPRVDLVAKMAERQEEMFERMQKLLQPKSDFIQTIFDRHQKILLEFNERANGLETYYNGIAPEAAIVLKKTQLVDIG